MPSPQTEIKVVVTGDSHVAKHPPAVQNVADLLDAAQDVPSLILADTAHHVLNAKEQRILPLMALSRAFERVHLAHPVSAFLDAKMKTYVESKGFETHVFRISHARSVSSSPSVTDPHVGDMRDDTAKLTLSVSAYSRGIHLEAFLRDASGVSYYVRDSGWRSDMGFTSPMVLPLEPMFDLYSMGRRVRAFFRVIDRMLAGIEALDTAPAID